MKQCIPIFYNGVYGSNNYNGRFGGMLSPTFEIRHLTLYDVSENYDKVAKQIECCYIYIDVQYTGEDSDGSKDRPYTNFQDAIDRAKCIFDSTTYLSYCGYICIVALSPCTITETPVCDLYGYRRIIIGAEDYSRITINWSFNPGCVYGFINCDLHFEERTQVKYLYKCALRNCIVNSGRYNQKLRCIACEIIDSSVGSSLTDPETPDSDGVLGAVFDCYGSPTSIVAYTVANCNFYNIECNESFRMRGITMYNCKIHSKEQYPDTDFAWINASFSFSNCIKSDIEVYVAIGYGWSSRGEVCRFSNVVSDVTVNCHIGWNVGGLFLGCVVSILEDTVVSGLTVKSDITRIPFDDHENDTTYAYCDIAKQLADNYSYICLTECNKGTYGEPDNPYDCEDLHN